MNINQAIGKVGERWNSLSKRHKIIIGGIGAALVLGLVFFGQWIAGSKYAPLFTDLSPEQGSAVMKQLDEMKISYKVSGEGDTILVPEDVLYKTRLQLAGSGILEGADKGFELFDETQLGSTDFERRLNYQRALQEELRRTITYLEEVEMARVHLVLPEESLFIEEELPSSASIVLDLKPLAELKPEQVKGIIYLVSTSVENLPPENVNIIDTSGRILSEGVLENQEAAAGVADSRQSEMKRDFENNLEDRVGKMLEKIMGPGKAVVMITADLTFDQRQVTRIDYGEDGVVRGEELVEKSSVSAGGTGGVPGAATNIGEYGTAMDGSQVSQTETHQTRNYEIDEITETTVYAPGQLERLSTSVAVDGDLGEDDIEQIRSIVTAAVGYQPERGDQINVVSRTFDKSMMEQAQAEMQEEQDRLAQQERLKEYILWGAAALAAAALGVTALVIWRRKRRERRIVEEDEIIYPIPVSEMEAVEEPEEEIDEQERKKEVEQVMTEEEKKRKGRFEKVKDIAAAQPDEAAALVRAWLSEE
ncbi:MAG: flagellar basal-body MS-ring/collar protein FliF [Bacillota bacterium]